MRRTIAILALVAAIAAEAPYNLPRPGVNAPAFNYPQAPAPLPLPQTPVFNRPQATPFPFQPAPQYQQQGYNYQQPSIAPAFVQPPPQPQPLPAFRPPAPQPLPVNYPQPQPLPQPRPTYGTPQQTIIPQPAPQPIPTYTPQPAPLPQQQFIPQPQPIQYPQQQHYQQQQYQQQQYQQQQYQQQQFNPQQGYSYQQPQIQYQPQQQFAPQFPLQSQPISYTQGPSFSSYHADSTQYNTAAQAATHRDALDSIVVGRVQNIIKDNEHDVARNRGYQSLVSGVALENARPSVEVLSFTHNSPLTTGQRTGGSISQSFTGSSSGVFSRPSSNYGVPSITGSSQSGQSSVSFLPQNKPAAAYGPPNK